MQRHAKTGGSSLVVEDVGKTFGHGTDEHRVIEGLSLRVDPGEFVCIVGPSGAGKTTLLRCLSGLIRPTSGTIRYGDEPLTRPHADIAVVFQDYRGSLLPWMRVRDNVAFPLEGMGVKRAERNRRAEECLHAVGLADVGDKYPWQLSGGMQQRVAIARGLAYEAPVLLMDEPFGSVDAQSRFDLEDLTLSLRADLGITVILVTHDIDEAVYLGDRVVVIGGRPTTVVDNLQVDLGTDRDQITTRADHRFTDLRTRLLTRIREAQAPAERTPARPEPKPAPDETPSGGTAKDGIPKDSPAREKTARAVR
ncbi:ABC transporter ATP-binding protein [Streptomyces aurantiacus]|uniref:ABC transporter ATP-binding protein n=1 Tax=Streptomyces aurantiacus TaxID=47760 RepID=UPI0006E1B598|nr:ABC transporter ATP-binding protein [Streptomyces aurantiacus]